MINSNSFNDFLRYHNLSDNNDAFNEILDDPSKVLNVDRDFLKGKNEQQRRDLILGEYLNTLSNYIGAASSRLLKRGQWGYDTPNWFDHRHHMLDLETENKNSWLESISLVLRLLPRNGKILNLCAGDGYFDGHFFSKAAGEITCVDIDDTDEYKNYLIKENADSNVVYIFEDIFKYNAKHNYYDIVLMRSAIEHFTLDEQIALFGKAKDVLTDGGWFCGDTPANPDRDQKKEHDDHENEWKDENEARELLKEHFSEVNVYSLYCNIDGRTTIFWNCR